MSLPSTLPKKVQITGVGRISQQNTRFLDHFTAFDDFLAHVEQPDGGLLTTGDRHHQSRPHHRKLQQMFGRAIHIRAQIEHRGGATARIGHLVGNGRAVDALHGFQQVP